MVCCDASLKILRSFHNKTTLHPSPQEANRRAAACRARRAAPFTSWARRAPWILYIYVIDQYVVIYSMIMYDLSIMDNMDIVLI